MSDGEKQSARMHREFDAMSPYFSNAGIYLRTKGAGLSSGCTLGLCAEMSLFRKCMHKVKRSFLFVLNLCSCA